MQEGHVLERRRASSCITSEPCLKEKGSGLQNISTIFAIMYSVSSYAINHSVGASRRVFFKEQ